MKLNKVLLAVTLSLATTLTPSNGHSAALAGIGQDNGNDFVPDGYLGALIMCGAFTFGLGIIIPICFLDSKGNLSKDVESIMKNNSYTAEEIKTVEGDLQKLRKANGDKQFGLKLNKADTPQTVKAELQKYADISDLTAATLFELHQIAGTSK